MRYGGGGGNVGGDRFRRDDRRPDNFRVSKIFVCLTKRFYRSPIDQEESTTEVEFVNVGKLSSS